MLHASIIVLAALRVATALSLDFNPSTANTVQVPPSFLGLSHEPLTMAKLVLPTPQYQGFLRLLSSFDTGPFIIRWGGNEQVSEGAMRTSWRRPRTHA